MPDGHELLLLDLRGLEARYLSHSEPLHAFMVERQHDGIEDLPVSHRNPLAELAPAFATNQPDECAALSLTP